MLTTEVHSLFAQWPRRLVEFCAAARITAEHFSQDRKDSPAWFEDFVCQHLCIQIRGISVDQVVAACESLNDAGLPVSKASVSRLLGSSYSNSIDSVLGQRSLASLAETMQFFDELASWTEVVQTRRSSTEIRLRDALVILLSISGGVPAGDVATWSKSKCEAAVEAFKGLADAHNVAAVRCLVLIEQQLGRYERFRCHGRPRPSEENESEYFVGFLGTSVPQRSLQRTISIAMTSLDPRLVRSISAFQLWPSHPG
jgi:hypothetical protein